MLHLRRNRDRAHGQIIVLFALVLVVILGFAAIVVDLGLQRNNRQILVNALDAAALAAGTQLPVDGSPTASPSGQVAKMTALIDRVAKANYPGLKTSDYSTAYWCMVGVDPSTNQAWVSRDLPAVCDPHRKLGYASAAAVPAGAFQGAGPTRYAACDPSLGDKCNVVQITGSAITSFFLAPVLGVNSGSTGAVVSTACNGPCGASPVVPVDLVIVLDRTRSMADNYNQSNENPNGTKIHSLQDAAKTVLSVYDPAMQRVALIMTGPSLDNAGSPAKGTCDAGGRTQVYGTDDETNYYPTTRLTASMTNKSSAKTITVASPITGWFPSSGQFSIMIDSEQMLVTGGQGTTTWTVTRAQNGTSRASHSSGAVVHNLNGWVDGPTTQGVWVAVGLSGTDSDLPAPYNPSGAGNYRSASSDIVQSINCISAMSHGTNLATPISMAQWYLDHYGRPGVVKGILLETDGKPEDGESTYPDTTSFTCGAAIAAANAAKADGIKIYSVGYGVSGSCPTTSANSKEISAWAGKSATLLLQALASQSTAPYYFNAPSGTQLADAFRQVAINLAHGSSHLVQLCPSPIVTSLSPATWSANHSGTSVTISGKYLSNATSVSFGGVPATSFSVTSDTSITARTSTATANVTVTTPCGTN